MTIRNFPGFARVSLFKGNGGLLASFIQSKQWRVVNNVKNGYLKVKVNDINNGEFKVKVNDINNGELKVKVNDINNGELHSK